tara:strand:- start:19882 stop:20703 length:822 start_codon:yes stop_codon:yes gene_type:complete
MKQAPDIPTHAIDIWYAYADRLIASDSIENHLKVLSDSEKNQLGRFSLTRVREESLASRLLTRHALSFYADVAPERWQFAKGPRGKPYVVSPWQDFHAFNLSHSANLVVFAIARHGTVGVDVESIDRATTGIPLARRFFASQEVEQLLALPPEMQRESFLQIWTLKEAYIKAVGDGLAMPLDRFFFDLTAAGPAQLHVGDGGQAGTEWLFTQLRLPSRHHIALGVTHPMLTKKSNKQQMYVRAREFKSTQAPITCADVVCTEKNAWYFHQEAK